MLITFTEVIYFIILTVVISYIFSDIFSRPKTVYDYMHPKKFNLEGFKIAAIATAPAIILHELAHKFVAMGFGFSATFKLFPTGLAIGVILKLVRSPLILIAPGYVVPSSALTNFPLPYRLVALAGPLTNLLLWLAATIILKTKSNLNNKHLIILHITKKINMILFLFNMIPFGPFDGAKVLFGPPSL